MLNIEIVMDGNNNINLLDDYVISDEISRINVCKTNSNNLNDLTIELIDKESEFSKIIDEMEEIIKEDDEEEKVFKIYKKFEKLFGMSFEECSDKIKNIKKEKPEKFI